MKLDDNSCLYINCRTQEEREMILDIFEYLGIKWCIGKRPRETSSNKAPMNYFIENKNMWHGQGCYDVSTFHGYQVVEARDFVNQWKSLKKNLDK